MIVQVIARGFVAFLFAAFFAPAAFAQDVVNCSRAEPSGERTLCHEVLVAAPVSDVWRLFTTSEGLRTWLAPVVQIDLREGGAFLTSYDTPDAIGGREIRNRVVAFTPERMLVIQIAQAPPGFAHGEDARELATVVTFEQIDDARTRVRVNMLGYREDPAFAELYGFFDRGNAWTLTQLASRVVNGPVDWNEER